MARRQVNALAEEVQAQITAAFKEYVAVQEQAKTDQLEMRRRADQAGISEQQVVYLAESGCPSRVGTFQRLGARVDVQPLIGS